MLPQMNFQPIYDRYAGNNNAEYEKWLNHLQTNYNTGEQMNEQSNDFASNMQGHSRLKDTDVLQVNKLRDTYKSQLESLASEGDFENQISRTKSLAKKMVREYTPFANNKQLLDKQIEEANKTAGWTNDYANQYIQNKIDEYQQTGGLKVDPVTGNVTNYINIPEMDKYYNLTEKVAETENKMQTTEVTNSLGHKVRPVTGPNGEILKYQYVDEYGTIKQETRDKNVLKLWATDFIKSSPEYLSVAKTLAYIKTPTSKSEIDAQFNEYKNDVSEKISGIESILKTLDKKSNDYKIGIKTLDSYKELLNNLNDEKINKKQELNNYIANNYINSIGNNVATLLEVNRTTPTFQRHYFKDEIGFDEAKKKQEQLDVDLNNTVVNKDSEQSPTLNSAGNFFTKAEELVANTGKNYTNAFNTLSKVIGFDTYDKYKSADKGNQSLGKLTSLYKTSKGNNDEEKNADFKHKVEISNLPESIKQNVLKNIDTPEFKLSFTNFIKSAEQDIISKQTLKNMSDIAFSGMTKDEFKEYFNLKGEDITHKQILDLVFKDKSVPAINNITGDAVAGLLKLFHDDNNNGLSKLQDLYNKKTKEYASFILTNSEGNSSLNKIKGQVLESLNSGNFNDFTYLGKSMTEILKESGIDVTNEKELAKIHWQSAAPVANSISGNSLLLSFTIGDSKEVKKIKVDAPDNKDSNIGTLIDDFYISNVVNNTKNQMLLSVSKKNIANTKVFKNSSIMNGIATASPKQEFNLIGESGIRYNVIKLDDNGYNLIINNKSTPMTSFDDLQENLGEIEGNQLFLNK
jgi:hypothetical protein